MKVSRAISTVLMLGTMACANGGGWTEAGALEGHVPTLDANGDGVVDRSDYESRRWNGPPFATADTNGDGQLSPSELARLVRGQSARHFDGSSARGAPLATDDLPAPGAQVGPVPHGDAPPPDSVLSAGGAVGSGTQ